MNSYSGKFRLYQSSDFPKLPAMRWFIKGLVPRHGITLLYGEAKIGKKSFVGISMACAIASGTDWCGFPTIKGKVLYIGGEDFFGLLRRQAAWEQLHGIKTDDGLKFLRLPINFYNKDEVEIALEALKAQGFIPDFVVIDTLQRSMGGGKENTTEDMSTVFEHMDFFRAKLLGQHIAELWNSAGMAIIHHTTKNGLNYRGSSVIKGAVDALIEVKAKNKGPVITLTSAGFKDVGDFDPFDVNCEPISVNTDEGWQEVLAVSERVTKPAADVKPSVSNSAANLLSLLAKLPNGAAFAQWRKASNLPITTFKRYRKELLSAKLVAVTHSEHGAQYHLTPQPQPTSNEAHNKDQLGTRATPFRSVAPLGPYEPGPRGPDLAPSGPLAPNRSCENADTTSNNENLNENSPDLIAEALEHLEIKRRGLAS
jgi:hypothetical protein